MSDPLQLLNYIKEAVDRVEGKIDGHDERIRKTESWQANADGKITAFGAAGVAIGGLITWIASFFKH